MSPLTTASRLELSRGGDRPRSTRWRLALAVAPLVVVTTACGSTADVQPAAGPATTVTVTSTATTTASTTVTREVTSSAAPASAQANDPTRRPAGAAAAAPATDQDSRPPTGGGGGQGDTRQSGAGQTSAGQSNAARSARQHLDLSGFSRSGLIEQLQYEGYSADQAAYGADAAGL